jgi:hypothetical protein
LDLHRLPAQLGEQDVAETGRHRRVVPFHVRPRQLFDVEGIAIRSPVDASQHVVVRLVTEDDAQLRRGLLQVERSEFDALHDRTSAELAEGARERCIAVDRVRSDRGEDQEPAALDVADEEGQQILRRAIRPVEVLDDEDHAPLPSDACDRGEYRLEQPDLAEPAQLRRRGRARRAASGEIRDDQSELVDHRIAQQARLERAAIDRAPQRFGEGTVWQAGDPELDTATGEDCAAVRLGVRLEFRHEACLTDPRLAPTEDGDAGALDGSGQCGIQPIEFWASADEGRAHLRAPHSRG